MSPKQRKTCGKPSCGCVREGFLFRGAGTDDCVELVVDARYVCGVAVPRKVSRAVLAICVSLLRFVVECAVSFLSRESVWEGIASCESAACGFGSGWDELAVLV